MRRKGWHIAELDLCDLAVPAMRLDAQKPGRGFQSQLCNRLGHRKNARFQQSRNGAHGVRSGHWRIFRLLHDDKTCIGVRMAGRDNCVATKGRMPARFAQHQ